MNIRDSLFNNFNEFINNQRASPVEVCMFIYSLLIENGYGGKYYNTGCIGNEYKLRDSEE